MVIYKNTYQKVIYVGPNFRSGLTDVQMSVTRPDGVTEGLFVMTEMPSKPGMYEYDYYLNQTGIYIFDCDSSSVKNRYVLSIDVLERIGDTPFPVSEFDV